MEKNHPLGYILRMRKPNENKIDMALDLIVATAYFDGQFRNKVPVEETREAFNHLKKLIKQLD